MTLTSNISFEEFNAIRDNLLPWKELPSIIEFYYMWKTSDRCVDQVNIYEKCFILDGRKDNISKKQIS